MPFADKGDVEIVYFVTDQSEIHFIGWRGILGVCCILLTAAV